MQHCAGFISAESLYMFRGAKRPSSGVFKTSTAAAGTCVIASYSSSSGVFKTSTAATGICVIVAGKSSHLLIGAGRP